MKKSKMSLANLFGIEDRKLWEKEWQNMPEFISEKRKDFAEITIRFRNKKDLKKFSRLIDQNLTERTKSIYYPALVFLILLSVTYKSKVLLNLTGIMSILHFLNMLGCDNHHFFTHIAGH